MTEPLVEPRLRRELRVDDPAVGHVASGSGLEVVGTHAVVVADDLHHVAWFDLSNDGAPGSLLRVFEGDLPDEHADRKAHKPDLEAVVLVAGEEGGTGTLVGLPSGSTDDRTRGFTLAVGATGRDPAAEPRELDLAILLAELEQHVDGECNLEGAACLGDELVLALRGVAGASALARVELAAVRRGLSAGRLTAEGLRGVAPVDLGAVDGVALGITDLAVVDGRLYATAAAEDTEDAYEDGEVLGSAVALLELGAPHPRRVVHLTRSCGKVEGLAAGPDGEFVLVTDDDDPTRPARMYELPIAVFGDSGDR